MRTYLSTVLIVFLAALTPLSAIAVWADLEIGDTDRFVSSTAPLASDPDVQGVVASRITDQAMARIDLGAADVRPLQDGIRGLLHEAVLSFATTDAFRNAWNTATRATHTAVEQVLTSAHGNSATIDLAPVTERVKRQLIADGVSFADRIPVRHTEITVLEANGLGVWRDTAQGLRAAGIWPAVGTVALAAAAVLLAPHRFRALTGVGLACAAGAGSLVIAVTVARGTVLRGLADNGDRSAAGVVYNALTGSLRTTAWCLLAAGLVLAAAAWLTGRLRGTRHAPHA